MLEEFIIDQPVAYTIVKKIVKNDAIAHAYLIETGNYYRGFDFAIAFAKSLLCPKKQTKNENCGDCTQCYRIDNKNFSELEIVEPDGTWIKKEQLDNLQKNFSTKSVEGNKKIYIINHADKLNPSAANSILKFLEEPEENIIAILVTNNVYSLLDTIISRCQLIKLVDGNINIKSDNYRQKIAKYLFNNEIEFESFNQNEDENSIIEETLSFVKSVETEGIDTILKETSLCSKFIKDKAMFNNLLNIMILFYKDCLEYMIKGKIVFFDQNVELVQAILQKNNITKILKKIEMLTKIQERIKYNCNLNLVLDKLIILLGGI